MMKRLKRNYSLFPSNKEVETIIKQGINIKLPKHICEETKKIKPKFYTPEDIKNFEISNKSKYKQIKTKPLFWNAYTRECSTQGTALFDPKNSKGIIKEDSNIYKIKSKKTVIKKHIVSEGAIWLK